MIASQDRSGWFGASDTSTIIGNWTTKSFANWWNEKTAFDSNNFTNESMWAGTYYEHPIMEHLGIPEMDKQILLPEIKLRVNLDGNNDTTIYEIKTFRNEKGFKVPIKYKRQVWVQMYASKLPKAKIVAYGLTDDDYKNFFNAIDSDRINIFDIEYDEGFINNEFLPKIKYLSMCLDNGKFPMKEDFEQWIVQ